MLDLTINSNNDRRHSLDLSDSMSILSLNCCQSHHLNGNIYSNLGSGGDVSTVNTETQTSHLARSSSSSSTNSSCTHIHQQKHPHILPSTPFLPWPSHHPQPLFYPVVSYHPIYSYAPSTSTAIQHQPTAFCIHPPSTTNSTSSDIYNPHRHHHHHRHHHDINSPIITSLHSQPSDEKYTLH